MKIFVVLIVSLFFVNFALAQNKVKIKHKSCKSVSDLAPYFKTCKAVKCGNREILGFKDDKCGYKETVKVSASGINMTSNVNCQYPKSYLAALADMYAGDKRNEEKVVNKHVNASTKAREAKLKKMKTYTIDGEETKNPFTLATKKGHCKQTFK